jgi:hypothetical protein
VFITHWSLKSRRKPSSGLRARKNLGLGVVFSRGRNLRQSKMVKVGINGFGRIGRLSFRGAWDMPELEIVADPPSPCNPQGKVARTATPARTPSSSPLLESTTRTICSPALPPPSCQVHVNELKGGARTSAYMLQVPRPSSVVLWLPIAHDSRPNA